MADHENILAPNSMGSINTNLGVDSISANYGFGVPEIQKAVSAKQEEFKERLRIAKAREFGMTKEKVGF